MGATRALVAGGAGFLGSHLCERLLERAWEVVALDNLATGSAANLAHLAGHPRFSMLEGDVSRPPALPGPWDAVLHLASPASPADFGIRPVEILLAGTLGAHNLLELAQGAGARFLLASSSEVYGDPLVHPQPETYWGNVNPIGPRGCYDEAKRCAEAFTMAYRRARGLDTRIVRIHNTYGPRMRPDDGRAVPTFFRQALAQQPLTVFGDGGQTRCFCYVEDLVDGIVAVLEAGDPMPFNLGATREVTVLELAQAVRRVTGSPSEIVFRPLPEDDPRRRRPDVRRAREVLGFEPKTALEEGLARTRDYFATRLAARQ